MVIKSLTHFYNLKVKCCEHTFFPSTDITQQKSVKLHESKPTYYLYKIFDIFSNVNISLVWLH